MRALRLPCLLLALAAAASPQAVKIGNYFVDSPYGISIIVDDATAFLIDPVWEEKGGKTKYSPNDAALVAPAVTAPDFSFSQASIAHAGANIRWTWGRCGASGVCGMLETDKPVSLMLRMPAATWPQFHAIYTATADGLTAYGIEPRGKYVPFAFRSDPPPERVRANIVSEAEMVFALDPKRPVRFVAGVNGELPRIETVAPTLKAAGERYAARRVSASGDWGDFPGAIMDNVNNSRLYGSDNQRIAIGDGRGWWLQHQKWLEGNADLFPYFVWDYFFHGALASLEDPASARETVRAVLSFQTPAGFVPSFSHWGAENNTYVTMHRSMPPVGALCVWKMQERWPDAAFLAEVYPKLVRWHEWWPKARDGNRNGLLEWGSEQHSWDSAQLETGWDDNVEYEGTRIVGAAMDADAVDLNALWSMDAEYLARIADALGKTADATRFRNEQAAINKRMNERLWNEELGIYCSRRWEVPAIEGPALADSVSKGKFGLPATGRYRFRFTRETEGRVTIGGRAIEEWAYEPDGKRTVDIEFQAGATYPVVIEGPGALASVHRLSPGKPGSDWLTRITAMNLYPLMCGAPNKARAQRVLEWLYREDKFWLPALVPSVPKDDPVWPKQHYWRGHVWPPANYLIWLGVDRYADPARRAEYARRSVRLFMSNWDAQRVCCENYRSTDAKCGDDPHYTWGALLNLIGVEALAAAGPDLQPVPRSDGAITENIVMRRVPFGGKLYRIEARGGKITATPETPQ